MENAVVVASQAEFDAWMSEQLVLAEEASQTPEGRGQALVAASGCAACHSTNGAVGVGPTWLNLFGRQEQLTDGSVITVDEAYIHESIRAPQAKIVAGFENQLMPAYDFTDEEIADIIAYLKTLK
jgi:cytochrome c oxidase subunit 2